MPAADFGQDLFGRLEGEVVQEQRDLLPIGLGIFGRTDDQRCRQQAYLLNRHMAVHPESAGERREVVGSGLAGLQKWHRHVRHPVLHIGRNLPVPMDDRANVEIIGQIDPEALARVEDEPLTRGPGKTKDGSRATVDIERTGFGGQAKRCGPLRHDCTRKPGRGKRRSTCGKKAASG